MNLWVSFLPSLGYEQNPNVQRGRVSLDPTWKRPRTEAVVCLAVGNMGQTGRGELAVFEGKVVGKTGDL